MSTPHGNRLAELKAWVKGNKAASIVIAVLLIACFWQWAQIAGLNERVDDLESSSYISDNYQSRLSDLEDKVDDGDGGWSESEIYDLQERMDDVEDNVDRVCSETDTFCF